MPSTMIRNVILLGPGGTTGAPILQALQNKFNLSVAIRSSSTFKTSNPNITIHTVNYTSLSSLATAFQNQDAVVSALTTFAVPTQRLIINAALEAGVKHFIPSEYGIDTSNSAAETYIPATRMKRDTVSYLQRTENRMSWTALCVGAYFDWAIQTGFGGYDWARGFVQIQGDGDYKYEATNLGRIGEAVVKCLENVDEVKNEYVYVHSFQVSQNQVLDMMQTFDKSRDWKVEKITLGDMYEAGWQDASETELNQGVAMMIRSVLMGYGKQEHFNDFGDKSTKWMQKLGLRDEELEESCRDIIAQRAV